MGQLMGHAWAGTDSQKERVLCKAKPSVCCSGWHCTRARFHRDATGINASNRPLLLPLSSCHDFSILSNFVTAKQLDLRHFEPFCSSSHRERSNFCWDNFFYCLSILLTFLKADLRVNEPARVALVVGACQPRHLPLPGVSQRLLTCVCL